MHGKEEKRKGKRVDLKEKIGNQAGQKKRVDLEEKIGNQAGQQKEKYIDLEAQTGEPVQQMAQNYGWLTILAYAILGYVLILLCVLGAGIGIPYVWNLYKDQNNSKKEEEGTITNGLEKVDKSNTSNSSSPDEFRRDAWTEVPLDLDWDNDELKKIKEPKEKWEPLSWNPEASFFPNPAYALAIVRESANGGFEFLLESEAMKPTETSEKQGINQCRRRAAWLQANLVPNKEVDGGEVSVYKNSGGGRKQQTVRLACRNDAEVKTFVVERGLEIELSHPFQENDPNPCWAKSIHAIMGWDVKNYMFECEAKDPKEKGKCKNLIRRNNN